MVEMSRALLISVVISACLICESKARHHQRPPGPPQNPQGQRPPQGQPPQGQPPQGQQGQWPPPPGQPPRGQPHHGQQQQQPQNPGQPQQQPQQPGQGQPAPGPYPGRGPPGHNPGQFPGREQRPPPGRPPFLEPMGPPNEPPPPFSGQLDLGPDAAPLLDNFLGGDSKGESVPGMVDFYGGGFPPDPKDELIPMGGPKKPGSPSVKMTEEEMEDKVGEMVYEMLEVVAEEQNHRGGGSRSGFMASIFHIMSLSLLVTFIHVMTLDLRFLV